MNINKKSTVVYVLIVVAIILLSINIYMMATGEYIKIDQNSNENEEGNNKNNLEDDNVKMSDEDVIQKEKQEESKADNDMKITKEYDVIVFGAEPEGIVAAISAARNKLKVLLVEKRDGPGGLMTYGMLNTIDMNRNKDGILLSQGIFEEFFEKIGNKISFDVQKAKIAFEEMLDAEENIDMVYNVNEVRIGAEDTNIKYAIIDGKKYVSKVYIDCTQDADISVMAGARYTIGWEDINEKNRSMSATLVIKMDGVDWEEIKKVIVRENLPNTGCTNDSAWGFGYITQKYVPDQTHMRLKALNIGRQDDNSVLINSIQVLNVNMLDEVAKEHAYKKCVKEAESVATFLKNNVPGFKNSSLVECAPELYVRETRHILGEYKLTVKDIIESTYFNDSIAMASYPIDVQTTSIYDWGYIIGTPNQYYIPFGVVVPKGFTNLLTIGRSGSYTSIAAGSARVIPIGMTLAESAGIISAVSIEKEIDFQELLSNNFIFQDIKLRMKMQGVYIDNKSKPILDKDHQYYKFIIEMCEKGILSLGYQNTFDPETKITEADFIVLVKTYLKRSFIRENIWNTDHINLLDASDKVITPNRAKEIIYDITTYNLKDETEKEAIENYLSLILPSSNEELSQIRVYEILVSFKDFLIMKGE